MAHQFIGVSGGYLGDFSYRTHAEFYPEFCDLPQIDPDSPEYSGTTRERFIQILSSRSQREQAAILRGLLDRFAEDADENEDRARMRLTMTEWIWKLESTSPVRVDLPSETRAVVIRALNDADALLSQFGATSVVDRVHTALHGHLHAMCEAAGLSVAKDATLAALLKSLRTSHPALVPSGPRAADITRMLQAMGTVLDALNPLRNHASVAHPNRELLGEHEAMLAVNAARTIFVYLESKISIQNHS
ncbi:abortive infection family protein [Kocuria sp. LUK]|uniref:abortive infection family protein n=1 Tax=Kocuria sp. LUK TaxID=2897828 RepID=UPI001E458EDD|nr:abortive infection family protein [Kocuria sp. LUK]MCD1143902.1 abortive infection family protein [Kocuria sp. LUK]